MSKTKDQTPAADAVKEEVKTNPVLEAFQAKGTFSTPEINGGVASVNIDTGAMDRAYVAAGTTAAEVKEVLGKIKAVSVAVVEAAGNNAIDLMAADKSLQTVQTTSKHAGLNIKAVSQRLAEGEITAQDGTKQAWSKPGATTLTVAIANGGSNSAVKEAAARVSERAAKEL